MNNTDYEFKKIKKFCFDNNVLLIDVFYDYNSAMTCNSVEYHRYTHCIVMDKNGIKHNVSDSSNNEVIENIKRLIK